MRGLRFGRVGGAFAFGVMLTGCFTEPASSGKTTTDEVTTAVPPPSGAGQATAETNGPTKETSAPTGKLSLPDDYVAPKAVKRVGSVDPSRLYTIKVSGAVIAPADKHDNKWDANEPFVPDLVVKGFVEGYLGLPAIAADAAVLYQRYLYSVTSPPDAAGYFRILRSGVPSGYQELPEAGNTFNPTWDYQPSVFRHQKVDDTLQVEVTLRDVDTFVDDEMGHVNLLLKHFELAAGNGVTYVNTSDQSRSIMFVGLELIPE